MTKNELRPFRQSDSEVGVTVYQKRERIPASLVDISQDEIVLISEKRILHGTEVGITMDHIDNFAIHGTIKLALLVNKEGKSQYRLGIATDQIFGPEDILESIPVTRYAL